MTTAPLPKDRVLDPTKLRVIRAQLPLVKEGAFFLAGGTGLALHLGHRLSVDLASYLILRTGLSHLRFRGAT